MFRFSFSLPIPYRKRFEWFSTSMSRKISSSKAFEWQSDWFGWGAVFTIDLELIPWGSDHAAIGFEITVLGFMIAAKIYDTRHWDYDNARWEEY